MFVDCGGFAVAGSRDDRVCGFVLPFRVSFRITIADTLMNSRLYVYLLSRVWVKNGNTRRLVQFLLYGVFL